MLLNCIVLLPLFQVILCVGLEELFTWSRINYVWPDTYRSERSAYRHNSYFPYNREESISFPDSYYPHTQPISNEPPSNIDYIYQNNIPMGTNMWKDKLFLTIPRRKEGIPSTLNYVKMTGTPQHNAPLNPYPDWETNSLGNSSNGGRKIVSVYRTAIDECDRLWFVDTGILETGTSYQRIQPSALVAIDLNTDAIINYHVFEPDVLTAGSGRSSLAFVAVDVTYGNCDNSFVYIPDLAGFGLIVYSLQENRAWRISHNFFHLEPTGGDFHVAGFNYQWGDGIFSIALSDVNYDGFRHAFFHSLSGFNEYTVSTAVLKNQTLATRAYHGGDFQIVGNKGERTQTSASDLHKPSGVLFLGLIHQNALGCWNIGTPLEDLAIVQKDNSRMIYPADTKVSGNDVLVLTNNLPILIYSTLNYDEVNFRVWRQSVHKAIEGTRCDLQHFRN